MDRISAFAVRRKLILLLARQQRRQASDLGETLCLPKTSFPMRAQATLREPAIQRACLAGAYEALNRRPGKPYVLHDGPPFANGPLHLGHVLNKTLKDMAVRHHALRGQAVHFIPGWDCHGLPIEAKALAAQQQEEARERRKAKKLAKKRQQEGGSAAERDSATLASAAPATAQGAAAGTKGEATSSGAGGEGASEVQRLRRLCRSFAEDAMATQMAGFQRLGVLADWAHPYTTMTPAYEAAQLRVFAALVEQELIYRQYKPVYWSPSSRTALAEAEIEYDTHTSSSAYVGFPLTSSELPEAQGRLVHAVVWTTTPWTLPANQAVAVSRKLEYVLCQRFGNEGPVYVVATARREALEKAIGQQLEVLHTFKGAQLEGASAAHPLDPERPRPVVHADHVTDEAGTGIVHMAPAHGQEDYHACHAQGIHLTPDQDLVDDLGRFRAAAGAELAGLACFGEGSEKVLELLRAAGALLHSEDFHHRYPFDWRTKQPIMMRATRQWFANVASLRERALRVVEGLELIPANGRERLRSTLERRTEWCISRQRSWGVPLPVFYDEETDEALLTPETVAHVASVLAQHGTDGWWALPIDELLPAALRPVGRSFRRGTDTLDVWFDSGTSWSGALRESLGETAVADLYLEGSDQHRGWFQSSILTRAAVAHDAPCRRIATHGFVLDEHGHKMSKSLGNGVDPFTIIEGDGSKNNPGLGADVLRYWVASTDYTSDVLFGKPMLDTAVTNLRKLRNTGRFLLGNLEDFDAETMLVPFEDLPEVDRYMLHLTRAFVEDVNAGYSALSFQRVTQNLNQLSVNDLSGFYFEMIKDRLYLEHRTGHSRRSVQTVLHHLLTSFRTALLPIACHLGEELYHFAKGVDPAVADPGTLTSAMQDPPTELSGDWEQPALASRWTAIRGLRSAVFRAIHTARAEGHVHTSADACVHLVVSSAEAAEWIAGLLQPNAYGDTLLNAVCLTSRITLEHSLTKKDASDLFEITLPGHTAPTKLGVIVTQTRAHKCPRCWRFVSHEADAVCERCQSVLRDDGHATEIQA